MFAYAALSGPLPKVGIVAAAALAAAAILSVSRRSGALAMLGALVLSLVLLLADLWNSPRLGIVHRHPLAAAVGGAAAVALLVAAGALIARRPAVVAPLAVLALPFRVPIQAGGKTSNLLVPLYLVVAAAALAWIGSALLSDRRSRAEARRERRRAEDLGRHRAREDGRGDPDRGEPPDGAPDPLPARLTGPADLLVWMERLLALYVLLYAVQAVYSADFVQGLQNVVFFYIPFALLYRLLRDLEWTPALVRGCLALTVALALVFSGIGFVEYATKTIILNSKLVVANDLHTYFTVNSVFFDPDIFGRYLALAMILLAVTLIYPRPQREQVAAVAALAVLWAGLVLTLSRSSLGALLVGLAMLAALRWRPSRALVVAAAVIVIGAAAVAASPRTFGLDQGINGASSGRGGLVSGGVSLFADRPLWGYGSGSFSVQYKRHHRATATTLSASHTIPVTVAAEQGVIGELAYAALVICALAALLRGARGDPVRAAVAAAFVALIFHTMLYADFLEDPTTWALLGLGVALARGRPRAGFADGGFVTAGTARTADSGVPAAG